MKTHREIRFSYIADQKAPRRKATGVKRFPDGVILTLECGHAAICNQNFQFKLGDLHICYPCGLRIALDLPEFAEDRQELIDTFKIDVTEQNK